MKTGFLDMFIHKGRIDDVHPTNLAVQSTIQTISLHSTEGKLCSICCENIVRIVPPIDLNDYQMKIQMKKSVNPMSEICTECFRTFGGIWKFKGMRKSLGKTKGMKKEKQREWKEMISI